MKFNFLKNNKKLVPKVMFTVSAVLVALIFVKLIGFLVNSARAGRIIEKAVLQAQSDPNEVKEYLAKNKKSADALKKKNLFSPPSKKSHPVNQVIGILGNEALINGKWFKVGDKVGDAEVVSITATNVKIVWEGKEKVFTPIASKSASKPQKKQAGPVVKKQEKKAEKPKGQTDEKVVVEIKEAQDDPFAWLGVELSAKAREKLLEQWNKMSDEQKEKFKEQWNNMSDEQKQKMVDRLESSV
ncbi:MAG: hypothetical protein ACYSSI_06180 [Planctomycetota bacterium]|jgi:hypothetical protein